jgi:biotin-(acetyl-CoA carboxylase) ligase
LNSKKFLVIGIGLNVVSDPKINNKYQTTNILSETKKKPSIKEIVNLIISSYEKFFYDLHLYNYTDFKKKAELMVSDWII